MEVNDMKKKAYIAPDFTTVTLKSKPLLNMVSQLGDAPKEGSSALVKGGVFWSDNPKDEDNYDEE